MAQQVKDMVLSLLWFRSVLWCGFSPWPGNFHMLWVWQKKKKKKKRKERKEKNFIYSNTKKNKTLLNNLIIEVSNLYS